MNVDGRAYRTIWLADDGISARREPSPIDRAMEGAITTAPEARDPGVLAKLRRLSSKSI